MAIFTHVPSWSTSLTQKPKTFNAQFGDGYEQATPNGLNNVLEEWNLTFKDIKDAEYFQIKGFLKSMKGTVAFQWLTPDGDLLWFRCREWSANPPSYGVREMNMKFEQVIV